MEKKLIRVALHLMAEDVPDVLSLLSPVIFKVMGMCVGIEITEAQDERIISLFTPSSQESQEEQNEQFNIGERVVYVNPKTHNQFIATVQFMQGDLVAVQIIDGDFLMVDPKCLRHT